MSEECTHNCESCGVECESRDTKSFLEKPNPGSRVKKVIGVVSGKGGVGKSSVTSLLAVSQARRGRSVAIMDADVTGPSIPMAFGVTARPTADENGICPPASGTGIKIMSINLLLENATDPVVWRGPVIAGTVKQFWSDVAWGEVDYMFVDMPPGTGDVPLTVFQSLPVDGVVVVTTPQDLVGMIVEKAVNMARMLQVPVLGIVENMSWLECPCCGEKLPVFGASHADELKEKFGLDNVVSLPLDPKLAAACDRGAVELMDTGRIDAFADRL